MMTNPSYVKAMPDRSWPPDAADILELLASSEPVEAAILAAGSNYVYLLTLKDRNAGEGYAVYKPMRGEAPLHDFPGGTLYKRERAAYLISEALGWNLIPPTVIREEGMTSGVGVLQLFIIHDPAQNYFTLRDTNLDAMKQIAVFDWLTNNADRKGGHCLLARDGRLWCIDQGLTLHSQEKLRTVIWDFQDQPIPEQFREEVGAFATKLQEDGELRGQLEQLVNRDEYAALHARAELIAKDAAFPRPPATRPYPWPII